MKCLIGARIEPATPSSLRHSDAFYVTPKGGLLDVDGFPSAMVDKAYSNVSMSCLIFFHHKEGKISIPRMEK